MSTYINNVCRILFRNILVLLSSFYPVPLTSSKVDVLPSFLKSHPTSCGPTRLSSGWMTQSKSACVISCRTRYGQNCRGFMYNKVTRLCTPSSGLSGSFPAPSVTEGGLYLMRSPDIYPDFGVKSFFLASSKVAYYTNKLNYTDATSVCACLDSHLYMANTYDKYFLISYIVNLNDKVWIGLDDMATEGTFVWSGNGQIMDTFLKFLLFGPFQPDNAHEDCVYKQELGGLFNYTLCSENMSYICEKI